METGTLKELNVRPGDVVIFGGLSCAVQMTVGDDMIARGDDGSGMVVADSVDPEWRIISRAAQPTPDLTAITTPFGLLDDATQEALRAHGGPYERWFCEEWMICDYSIDGWDGDYVYRVKAQPPIENVAIDAWVENYGGVYLTHNNMGTPVRVTFNRINGVIDLASYKVEPR